ncbi:MAG: response regulator transcription factor, partial [Chitinophagales bacterium]
ADVILMDSRMPKLNGIEATRMLLKQHPTVKVVALSMLQDETSMTAMFEAGARAYVTKNVDGTEIISAINTVLEGKLYVLGKIMNQFSLKEIVSWSKHAFIHISEREKEVLLLICKELSMTEIAEQLHISVNTVQNHRNHLLDKINVHNTAGLVMYANKMGWV